MFNRAIFLFILLQSAIVVAFGQQKPSYAISVTPLAGQIAAPRLKTNAVVSGVVSPSINYTSPQTYLINSPITPLAPVNSGGAIPPAVYGQVSTVASGIPAVRSPSGIVTDAAGTCYFTNYSGNVTKVTPGGGTTIIARINSPAGLAIDGQDNLYVTDLDDCLIYKITPAGVATIFAGSGYGSADGAGAAARFANPGGICTDLAGNIYVLDKDSGKIRKISPAGVVTTLSLNGGVGFPGADGLCIDAQGNIYIADSNNNLIRKVTPTGAVSTLAGSGASRSTDGAGTSASFYYPTAITVDGQNNLYVCDYRGMVVRKITAAGVVTTIAGTGASGTNDGIGRNAQFAGPLANSFDPGGNTLYITDFAGQFVKKIALSGYTIDKILPTGLNFDQTTGIISGTPSVLWPPTDYTITGYNGGGSSVATVRISVLSSLKNPSIITLPLQQPNTLDANNNYDPKGTSTNNETLITYTSSNPDVAIITSTGAIHVVGPGVTIITANQAGNNNFYDASPVSQTLTITEYLSVSLPAISDKLVCATDFDVKGYIWDTKIPYTYTSSNTNVATISPQGIIHIVGAGLTTITLSQNTTQQYYVSAIPKSQTLNVVMPVVPSLTITMSQPSPCLGADITFTADKQNEGANPTYQWMVNDKPAGSNAATFVTNALADGDKVLCILTNNDSNCSTRFPATSNTIVVTLISPVTPMVTIAASADRVFQGTPITFTATVANGTAVNHYQWLVNNVAAGTDNQTFTSADFKNGDEVKCVIAAANVCSAPAESAAQLVTILAPIIAPNTFTPNNDGVNDKWSISGLLNFPDCEVDVFNRFGSLLYKSRGYVVPWDGTMNGETLPAATYYYVIDIGAKYKKFSGSVTIIK